jgi:hypothetical protein
VVGDDEAFGEGLAGVRLRLEGGAVRLEREGRGGETYPGGGGQEEKREREETDYGEHCRWGGITSDETAVILSRCALTLQCPAFRTPPAPPIDEECVHPETRVAGRGSNPRRHPSRTPVGHNMSLTDSPRA